MSTRRASRVALALSLNLGLGLGLGVLLAGRSFAADRAPRTVRAKAKRAANAASGAAAERGMQLPRLYDTHPDLRVSSSLALSLALVADSDYARDKTATGSHWLAPMVGTTARTVIFNQAPGPKGHPLWNIIARTRPEGQPLQLRAAALLPSGHTLEVNGNLEGPVQVGRLAKNASYVLRTQEGGVVVSGEVTALQRALSRHGLASETGYAKDLLNSVSHVPETTEEDPDQDW